MDRLTDIALFLKVLDLGSISAAARHLDLSIAVASKRLQRLEQELGVRLLHRTTRHVHATAEGVALADQGRQLVEDLESLTSGLGRGGIEVTGTLRVSTSPHLPGTWRLKGPSGREVTARINNYLESNLGDSLRDAALAGLGIALHSTWHVCEDLRAGRLEIVLPDYPVADTAIYAVMPQRRLVPARVRAFTEFLAAYFGETPPWHARPKAALTTATTPRRPHSNSRTPRRSSQ